MKFNVYATVVGSKYLGVVEANNEEDAIEKAWALDACYVSLCHQCSDEVEEAEVTEITATEKTYS